MPFIRLDEQQKIYKEINDLLEMKQKVNQWIIREKRFGKDYKKTGLMISSERYLKKLQELNNLLRRQLWRNLQKY